MGNIFHQTTSVEAMRQLFDGMVNEAGNVGAGASTVYPDQSAPIVTARNTGHVLRKARWGLPSPPTFHTPSGIDLGVTNVRTVSTPHWRRWLGTANRCLVPVDRFAEPRQGEKWTGKAWFKRKIDQPMFFAGLWVSNWTSVRKLKDGATTDDLFAFLTCEPNAEVAEIHPKAMPVILTEPDEWAAWLSQDWALAKVLQRPLPDGSLELVAV
jgi:putative SOS response-associated peptidase YedK